MLPPPPFRATLPRAVVLRDRLIDGEVFVGVLVSLVSRMKIDSYTHFACPAFMDHLEAESGHSMVFRGLFSAIPELSNIDARIRQGRCMCTSSQVYTCNMLYLRRLLSPLPTPR